MDPSRGHSKPTSGHETGTHGPLTHILNQMRQGDEEAGRRLLAIVYDELRELAAAHLNGERPGHTLQPTALVHEAFLRLFGNERGGWQNRSHFFGAAGQAMRRILVDYARRRKAAKRGGGAALGPLPEDAGRDPQIARILAIDEILDRLGASDARKKSLVELRVFAGLTLEEAAQTLEISLRTAKRDWAFAKAWLYRELGELAGMDGEAAAQSEHTSSAENGVEG